VGSFLRVQPAKMNPHSSLLRRISISYKMGDAKGVFGMTSQSVSYQQTRWSLEDLFTTGSPQELDSAFTRLNDDVRAFADSTRPLLAETISSEDLLAIVQQMEAITRQAYHLYGFASLSFAGDTQDQNAQTLMGRVQQFMAEMENETLFFTLWWKSLDDNNAERLMSAAGDYRYWLEEMRHFKKYTLSEPEEKVINIKNVTGSSALAGCMTRSPTATPLK
jgi:oligoendopeptidase F